MTEPEENHSCVAREIPFPREGGEYTSDGVGLTRVDAPAAADAPAASTAAPESTTTERSAGGFAKTLFGTKKREEKTDGDH